MMHGITRTVAVEDLSPAEIATVFCGYDADQQAAFLSEIARIIAEWDGIGWCMQSYAISLKVTDKGRDVVRTLAGHVLGDEA